LATLSRPAFARFTTVLARAERLTPSSSLMSLRLSQNTFSMRTPARLPLVGTVRNCGSAAAISGSPDAVMISASAGSASLTRSSFTEGLVTRFVDRLQQVLQDRLLPRENFDVGHHARQDRQVLVAVAERRGLRPDQHE